MASPLILSLRKQKNYCGRKIKLLSPAKINLYLNILGKYQAPSPFRGAGFHRLESIVERVSLFDQVAIKVLARPVLRVSSNWPNLGGKNNTCFKAAQLLREKCRLPFGFDISIKKNIPVGSGLGGGSSNAASTLLGINNLCKLKLGLRELYRLGSAVGSDVNFFLSGSRFAFLEGMGEKVTPLKGMKFYHLIIWPGAGLSTKKVYRAWRPGISEKREKLTKNFSDVKILKHAIKKGDISLIKRYAFNALEGKALNFCKPLRSLARYLDERNLSFRVTGSGSSVYTIGEPEDLEKIKRILPKRWLVLEAQTF